MSAPSSTLTYDNKQIELAVMPGTIGPSVIDISKLYGQTGMFTYDPGFTSTAACESAITYIDGDEGVLLYRGYPIEQLAEHGDFLETCYLLSTASCRRQPRRPISTTASRYTMVHEQMSRFYQGFRRDAPDGHHGGCVGALSAFYHDSTDISDPYQRMVASMRMIAKMPTLAAMAFKYHVGQPFVYRGNLDYTSNFLRMCFAVPAEDYKSTRCSRARSTASSSCMRTTSRTLRRRRCASPVRRGANPFACIAAGIAPLGPAHGGANEAALKMLEEIGTPERIPNTSSRRRTRTIRSA